MNRISLCMIVRDEERFLAGCLDSVRGAVDEIVVVDTGSADRTRSIASAFGAMLVDFAWCDDFAAARNAGLAAASGTHVLVLDADERLARGSAAALRRAADDRTLLVGLMPLHDADALDAGEAEVLSGLRRLSTPTWLPRFFRREPELVFRRRVHESILLSVAARPRKAASNVDRIAPIDAAIVHLGEVKELRAGLGKRERNTRLLERALDDDPSDGEIAGFLAMELARSGDLARARTIGEASMPAFLARIDALGEHALKPSPVQLAQVLATCRLQAGDARGALATLDEAARRCIEPHPNLLFLTGTAHEALGETEEAERAYRSCLALAHRRFAIPVSPHFTDGAPKLRLANLALARGRATEALELLVEVGGTLDTAARLMRAEARLVARSPLAALTELAPLMRASPPPPDLFALAAWASALSGQDDPELLAGARSAPASSWVEPRRRSLLRST